MAKKGSRWSAGSDSSLRARRKPRQSSKALAGVSLSSLRRASPAENVTMGYSPKARRYVKAGAKVTKATASLSARQHETKRTKTRYGYSSPEAATKARQSGALHYESRAQGERVAKAKQTGFLKKLFRTGQEHKRLFERSRDGEIKLNKRGRKRGFTATPDRVAYVEQLRERKLAGEMLDRGEWFMLMNYAEALGDPALSRLRNSGARRRQEDEPDEGDYYEE